MRFSFRYGTGEVPVDVPADRVVQQIRYRIPQSLPEHAVIAEALSHPVGSPPLRELARGKRNAVVVISDMTRLCPSHRFLGALLDELNAGGVCDERIDVIVALGAHRPQTDEELRTLAGPDAWHRVRVRNHSCREEECVRVGTTSRGTPVCINRLVAAADLRIATGNVEPHRLVGISGGLKALMPGVASHACIEANHALSQRYAAHLGDPDNAVRADLEEAHSFVPMQFLLNVIADHDRTIVSAVSGDVKLAHRAIVDKAQELFLVEPPSELFDVVLASAGGSPKDLQLYQSVKALQNAAAFAKPGGTVLMAAQCADGVGSEALERATPAADNREQAVRRLRSSFSLGPHKLVHIDDVLNRCRVLLYSSLPDTYVKRIGLEPIANLQASVESLLRDARCRAAWMPLASLTFPKPNISHDNAFSL